MDYIKITLILYSIILVVVDSNINSCGSKKLNGCVCGNIFIDSKKTYVVNCTNQGFNNTDMLWELPEQTQILIFTGNYIHTLPMNIFGETDLSDLKVIDMSNNGIREIKGKTFHHVLGVQRLILNHNNISISNEYEANFHHPRVFSNFYNLTELHLTNAFADNTDAALANDLHDIFVNSNLTKLYKLHLEQNEIRHFKDENVFCALPNLHDIYLSNNNIPGFNFNVSCLAKIRFVDLSFNNITQVSSSDLKKLDKIAKPYRSENLVIDITGNPFKCDLAVKTLYPWLYKTNVQVRKKNILQCFQSKFGHKLMIDLKTLADAKHTRLSRGITISLIILTIILVTLLIVYIYIRKEKLQHKLSPIIDSLGRKVQYTTIESQDV